jgi:WD40-like Beta Propeller Repeat
MSRLSAALVLAVLLTAVAATTARADVFESTELVSQGFLPASGVGTQQAAYAHDPAISADGRYIAFDGSFGAFTGVWRRDLQTGEVRPVAVGRRVKLGVCATNVSAADTPCDAELPSISEDGQYVSFTTTAPLDPTADTNTAPDVYVRNMAIEPSEPESAVCSEAEADDEPLEGVCAYTIASAADGRDEGLTYSRGSAFGSVAAGRSAISGDGQKVAFVTTAVSDLADPQEPLAPATPALQVAVRDLAARRTILVSARFDPSTGQALPDEPVSAQEGAVTPGAVFTRQRTTPEFPNGFATGSYAPTEALGASISADGTTVAWMGTNISLQARVLSQENLNPLYAEPLWRRISEGETAPTRRVTGGSDPLDPACEASGEMKVAEGSSASTTDPCQGPFSIESDLGVYFSGLDFDTVPQLSADGWRVAFLATARLVSLGEDFGNGQDSRATDAYVSDMQPGLTRDQALTPLTEISGEKTNQRTNAPIVDLAISPDGEQVAFTTRRTELPLSLPAYVSAPAAIPGMLELFDADVGDETLTRVTQGFEGGPSFHPHGEGQSNEDPYPHELDGALSPSFAADGNLLAFSSTASNLVFGDGNTPPTESLKEFDGGDAFVVHRHVFASTPTPQSVSPPPPQPALGSSWAIGATALSLKNGSVRLYVNVPGAGTLRAGAQGAVVVKVTAKRSAHSAAKRGAKKPKTKTTVVTRTLATASKAAKGGEGELLTLTLTLASRYRSLATAAGGESSTVTVTFASPGHATLRQALTVAFVNTTHPKAKKAAKGHKASRAGKRRKGHR